MNLSLFVIIFLYMYSNGNFFSLILNTEFKLEQGGICFQFWWMRPKLHFPQVTHMVFWHRDH